MVKKKSTKKLPDSICSWNFCNSCIKYRLDNGFTVKYLRSSEGFTKSKLI